MILSIVSSVFFFVILIAGELKYCWQLSKKEKLLKTHKKTMSREDFDHRIAKGEKLVLLDDLVLNVDKFAKEHPGGRFLITHNIGRDISKFYYGGYSLEDNLGASPAKGYIHSNFAHRIVKDLTIARFLDEEEVATTRCFVREDLCRVINSTTKTIVFENIKG